MTPRRPRTTRTDTRLPYTTLFRSLGALANRLLHHDGAAQLGPVNIHRLLERLCDLLQAESAPPQLRHDYDPSVPDLHGDADRLQQVLLNLARNALDAGAHTLTLRTRVEHGLRATGRASGRARGGPEG